MAKLLAPMFTDLSPYNRIIVVGSPGSGKSHVASRVSWATGLKLTHLDKEFYRRNWEPTPRDVWVRKQEAMIAGEHWIIDGNYANTLELRWQAADLVIFLDIGRVRCILSLMRRTGKIRSDLPDYLGNPKLFSREFRNFIKNVWEYPKKGRKKVIALHEIHPEVTILHVRSRRQANKILAKFNDKNSIKI